MKKIRFTLFVEDTEDNREVIEYIRSLERSKSRIITNLIKNTLHEGQVGKFTSNHKREVINNNNETKTDKEVTEHKDENSYELDSDKVLKGLSMFGAN